MALGAWLSLVERFVRDEEVARSNRVAPKSSSQMSPARGRTCNEGPLQRLFSNLNLAARRVLRLAEQECRNHSHYYVGAEHLLVALLEERDPETLARARCRRDRRRGRPRPGAPHAGHRRRSPLGRDPHHAASAAYFCAGAAARGPARDRAVRPVRGPAFGGRQLGRRYPPPGDDAKHGTRGRVEPGRGTLATGGRLAGRSLRLRRALRRVAARQPRRPDRHRAAHAGGRRAHRDRAPAQSLADDYRLGGGRTRRRLDRLRHRTLRRDSGHRKVREVRPLHARSADGASIASSSGTAPLRSSSAASCRFCAASSRFRRASPR